MVTKGTSMHVRVYKFGSITLYFRDPLLFIIYDTILINISYNDFYAIAQTIIFNSFFLKISQDC
jgi:hypothetical protein